MMNRQEIYSATILDLFTIYTTKNADYGNSFTKVRDKFPNAILVRLNDKLNRLESILESNNIQVKDESIDDTLKDLANYCILELIERQIDRDLDIQLKQALRFTPVRNMKETVIINSPMKGDGADV